MTFSMHCSGVPQICAPMYSSIAGSVPRCAKLVEIRS